VARAAAGQRAGTGPARDGAARAGPDRDAGRRRRFWGQPGRHGRRIALIAGVVVVVLVVALVGSYFYLDSKLNRSVALPAFSGQSAGQNWLIAGSDSRQGLSQQQIDSLHVGDDFGTDELRLADAAAHRQRQAGADQHPARLLRADPRSRRQQDQRGARVRRAVAAHPDRGEATGLQINHYMGIGFGGLVSVVNQVGGVTMCLPKALHDYDSGANLPAGCHNLDGAQALAFVRDRHSFADEDLQRIEDQRAFLKALLSKATSPGVYLNPFVALPFGSAAASSISVDQGTQPV
jgi:hypothetical protein